MRPRRGRRGRGRAGQQEREPERLERFLEVLRRLERNLAADARHIEQLTILFEACEPEHRYTALAGSEEFTGSPKLKILTRDFKTVCCIADDLKPRLSVFGKRLSI